MLCPHTTWWQSAADVTEKVFTDETKINFCQNDEKRNDPKLSTASVKHAEGDVMAQAWLSAETCKLCLPIMWLLTKVAGWTKVYRTAAQIQPNAAKLMRRRFTLQMDKPKQTAKSTQEFLKAKKGVLQWAGQTPEDSSLADDLTLTWFSASPKWNGNRFPVDQPQSLLLVDSLVWFNISACTLARRH